MEQKIPEKTIALLHRIGDGYQCLRLLGEGSIGTVYECIDSQNHHVAVKLMETNPMMDTAIFESIIQAALATTKIPAEVNVVRVLSAGQQERSYYIIMEMMPGGTLEAAVEDISISLKTKLKISADIAQIIAAIHKRGIVHGDLKPSNILMSDLNKPYLNDFYLFPSRGAGTMPSMPLGTPYYMSPEQAKGSLITNESDIYSFGVMLYELLTGKMPYVLKPDNIQMMVKEIIEGSINRPRKANAKINNKLEAVMLKLLEKDPSRRYQHMDFVANDIIACLKNRPISIPYQKTFIEKIKAFFFAMPQ